MKRHIPDDFKVTDDHRKWSVDKGWPLYLPDTFLPSFKDHFQQKKEDKDPKGKHVNWHACFKRWIRQSSPSGDFYNSGLWERRCSEAKYRESQQFKRQGPPVEMQEKRTQIPKEVKALINKLRAER